MYTTHGKTLIFRFSFILLILIPFAVGVKAAEDALPKAGPVNPSDAESRAVSPKVPRKTFDGRKLIDKTVNVSALNSTSGGSDVSTSQTIISDGKGAASWGNVDYNSLLNKPLIPGSPATLPPSGNAGGDLTATFPNPVITAGAVTTAKIADGSVTVVKLAPGVVPTTLPPTGPASGDLTGTFPSPVIADGAVTTAKLAVGVIPTTLPPTGAAGGDLTGTFPNPGIAVGAVSTAKIADGTVTAAKLAPGVIPTTLPPVGAAGGDLTGTFPNPTIATGAITNAKIAVGAVNGSSVDSSSVQLRVTGTAPTGEFITAINQNGSIVSAPPAGGTGWSLIGNSGTNPATNFLGTTDSQDIAIRSNNVEGMRLSTSGLVGIGTSSPSRKLHLSDAGGNVLRLERTTATARQWDFHIIPSGSLLFGDNTAGQDRFSIDTSGNIGIGTNTPGSLLDVAGAFTLSNTNPETVYHSGLQRPNATDHTIFWYGGGIGDLLFKSGALGGAGDRMVLTQAGRVGIGTTIPGKGLHVVEASGNVLRLERTTATARQWDINIMPNGTLDFGDNTASQDRFVIDKDGNVGVGTVTPGKLLEVAGDALISGNLTVTGTVSKGAGTFKIDHPLDPENKFLSHSFVESPDMKNMYDGMVVLDDQGEAWVSLPSYFQALNQSFCYQLTPIGGPAPGLFVAQEIEQNRFKISGGVTGRKVSWMVTGIRHDAYATAHPTPVEQDKSESEKGLYLHPDAFGKPKSQGLPSRIPIVRK